MRPSPVRLPDRWSRPADHQDHRQRPRHRTAHVATGTGIGITVESALDHQPPGLRIIPFTGLSTIADQVVLTPAGPSDATTALRDLLLSAASTESPSAAH
ncbi:hypothetical protein [Kitasatospora sp. NPDC001225]